MEKDDIIIALTDVYEDKIAEWEENFFATVELLGEVGQECDRLREEVKVLKAFVMKVHTSPVIFEDVNRALRDDAKTLLEKLNQSAESERQDESICQKLNELKERISK